MARPPAWRSKIRSRADKSTVKLEEAYMATIVVVVVLAALRYPDATGCRVLIGLARRLVAVPLLAARGL